MEQWNSLMQGVLAPLGPYAPRLAAALGILVLAALLARLARTAALRMAASIQLEHKLQTPGLVDLLGNIASWLVWLFALPALLDTLQLDGLLAPVNAMVSRLMGFVPNLMGAGVILGAGWLAARILRQMVSGLLMAAGSEKLAQRLGLGTALGDKTLAGSLGSVVFVLVMLPTLTASLQALGLEAVAKPVGHLLDTVVELIPRLISAALIVAIGAVVGRIVSGIVTTLLAGAGLNKLAPPLGKAETFRLAGRDASELAGGAVMVAALLLAVTQACEVLGFAVLTEAVAMLGGVLAHLAVAVVLLGVGLWLATAAAHAISQSQVKHSEVLASLAKGAILFFTGAMAMRQAGLPADIIAIAFGSVVGSLALGLAIAVGMGGRHVAARLLESAVASFEQPSGKDQGSSLSTSPDKASALKADSSDNA